MAKRTTPKVPGLVRREGAWHHGASDQRHSSAEYTIADALAVQAMALGEASADQQKRAIKWIVEGACMAYGETFDPLNDRTSSFSQGRRFAGRRIIALTKVNTAELAKAEDSQEQEK